MTLRSGLEFLMGKVCKIFIELSAWDTPIFLFPDNNLSKYQGILTKLAKCIDIKEIWLELLTGKFLKLFTELPARDMPIFSFSDDNLSK